nr:MAG TPA: hypothetical protein [Caudoviricetes sp.]
MHFSLLGANLTPDINLTPLRNMSTWPHNNFE